MTICEGRVVVVTGAGRGIGREDALEFARQGARVVVNDLGAAPDGSGTSTTPAEEVVEAIRDVGGEAALNTDDVSDWDGAQRLIDQAIGTFGRLDVLVNNAGILRDRMLYNLSAQDWDDVVRVHLRGHFLPTRFAASYWRDRSKAGQDNDARIINTSSASGLFGNVGQANYGAAKAGIAAFTIIAARELARYGVTVNAVSPHADTRLTPEIPGQPAKEMAAGYDPRHPGNIAPLVVWLASGQAGQITGRVFEVGGGKISVLEPWRFGPTVDGGRRWDPAELGDVLPGLVAEAADVEDFAAFWGRAQLEKVGTEVGVTR